MMDWQPIETAPKDGTRVLLFNGFVGQYVSAYINGEWPYGYDTGLRAFGDWYPQPSYWQPLPADPVQS